MLRGRFRIKKTGKLSLGKINLPKDTVIIVKTHAIGMTTFGIMEELYKEREEHEKTRS